MPNSQHLPKQDNLYRSVLNTGFSAFCSIIGLPIFNLPTTIPKLLGKAACVYFLVDSVVELEPQYLFHHLFGFLMGTALGFTKNTDMYISTFYMFTTLEYSTTLLNVYYITKFFPLKLAFSISFLYFRTYKYTQWALFEYPVYSGELNYICEQHVFYKPWQCQTLLYSGVWVICGLNILWGYYIVRNVNKTIKRYIKNN